MLSTTQLAVQPPFLASWQCKREKMRILALKTSPLIHTCRLPLLNKQEFASHECIQTGPSPPNTLKSWNVLTRLCCIHLDYRGHAATVLFWMGPAPWEDRGRWLARICLGGPEKTLCSSLTLTIAIWHWAWSTMCGLLDQWLISH